MRNRHVRITIAIILAAMLAIGFVAPFALATTDEDNLAEIPPAVTAAGAKDQFGDAISVYLDGGEAEVGEPSTIIDISGPAPLILREGVISAERIGEVLGCDPAALRRV